MLLYDTFWAPKPAPKTIPTIVTRYDTVTVAPKWLQDSISAWKKRKSTTDTVNIVISNTVIQSDTVYVGADSTLRPRIWPVLEYHSGLHFGDTSTVVTFDLRSGVRVASRLYTPGILVGISADSNSVPRLDYIPFPVPPKPPLIYTLKMFAIGFGACSITGGLK